VCIRATTGRKFEEFRKAKPPSFDGEIKKGEEAEAWLLGLKEVFQSPRLFRKYEGPSGHLQLEWKGFHLVGRP
jgi:hypothetical protein